MTDLELATEFFKRIQSKGFELKFDNDAYGVAEEGMPHFTCIDLYGMDGVFVTFDFYPDGAFHRISGFTRGFYNDEVDGTKY